MPLAAPAKAFRSRHRDRRCQVEAMPLDYIEKSVQDNTAYMKKVVHL
jgi:hypothetical protein